MIPLNFGERNSHTSTRSPNSSISGSSKCAVEAGLSASGVSRVAR
jgi:hypothetical protein